MESVDEHPGIHSLEGALDAANNKLNKHSMERESVTFALQEPGLSPGDMVRVEIPERGIDDEYWIESVKG